MWGASLLKFPVDFPEPGLSYRLSCTLLGFSLAICLRVLDLSVLSDVSLRALDKILPQDPSLWTSHVLRRHVLRVVGLSDGGVCSIFQM